MVKPAKEPEKVRSKGRSKKEQQQRHSWDDNTAVTEMKELYKSFGDEAREKLRELERSTDEIPSIVPGSYHQSSGETTIVVRARRRPKK